MINKIGTRDLETPRLLLRHFSVFDAPGAFASWCSDPLVTKYLTWPPHQSAEITLMIIEKWVDEYQNPEVFRWCIVDKATNQPIGSIDVTKLDERNNAAELGWCLARAHWGQGKMTEAASAVVGYLFTEANFHRIAALHHSDNIASGRVMQKIGMTYEGRKKDAWLDRDGHYADLVEYAIVVTDYEKNQSARKGR